MSGASLKGIGCGLVSLLNLREEMTKPCTEPRTLGQKTLNEGLKQEAEILQKELK